jgi:fructokinase
MRTGVDLGGTKIEIIALNDNGAIVLRRRVPTPAGDYSATVRAIADLVRSAQSQIGSLSSIGIATPGAQSPQTGLLRNSNSVALNGKPLDRDIGNALGLGLKTMQTVLPFRRRLMAQVLAVVWYLGLFWERTLAPGSSSKAGSQPDLITSAENGDIIRCRGPPKNERPGYRCYCGKHGCIETFLSGAGLTREYFSLSQKEFPAEQIAAAEEASEPSALRSLAM